MGIKKESNETNYFVLNSYIKEDGAHVTKIPELPGKISIWFAGKHHPVEVPEPLEYFINEDDEGYMRAIFNEAIPLFRDDLITALKECGADNFETFEAIVKETRTGKEYLNYKAVNILGRISAVDEEKSEFVSLGIGNAKAFTKLVLDEQKMNGHLMFRLDEASGNILIHKKVRDYLVDKGIERLAFYHPQSIL